MRFDNETEDENNVLLTGYRFIDLEVLTGVLDMIASCPNCGSKIKLLQTKKLFVKTRTVNFPICFGLPRRREKREHLT